jgi:antitoxin (DNA-binding transcriptional repressor) of toxin-antitoxin stability system
MPSTTVTVTEFSRGLSGFLNQVQYQGQVLDIARGERIIARVSPAAVTDGFLLDKLDEFFALGSAHDADRAAMVDDVTTVRVKLRSRLIK